MEDHPTPPGVSGSTPERKFHPVANVFPLLRGPEFQALVDDIQRHGLREPILCDSEGRILDGRNRYRACLQAGLEPRFVQWHGGGPLPELALSLNLRRRHLQESQRAMVAARLTKMLVPVRESDGASANSRTGQKARSTAAALVNVSPRLVDHACRVINNGGNELIAAVESGGLAVSVASLLAGLTKPEQAEAVAGGAQAAAGRARELRARKTQDRAAATSPGSFGVLGDSAPETAATAPTSGVVFLWVDAGSLSAAVAALRARGFRG